MPGVPMYNTVCEKQVFVGNLFAFCNCTRMMAFMAPAQSVHTSTQCPSLFCSCKNVRSGVEISLILLYALVS